MHTTQINTHANIHTNTCSVAPSCPTRRDHMFCSPPKPLCLWDSPGKKSGVGCHSRSRDRTRISCGSCIGRWILYHCTQKKYTNTHTKTQTRTYTWKTHKHTKYTDNIKHTHSHKIHTCINSQTPGCSWQQHQFWLTASTAQVLFHKGTCEQVYPCKGTCPAIKNNEAEFSVLMRNDVRGLSDRKVY